MAKTSEKKQRPKATATLPEGKIVEVLLVSDDLADDIFLGYFQPWMVTPSLVSSAKKITRLLQSLWDQHKEDSKGDHSIQEFTNKILPAAGWRRVLNDLVVVGYIHE